jgi:cell wall-associated NlpC family hydrolase
VPGDVIFTMDPEAPSRQHMGIYSGNGRMLHADGRTSSPYINESPIDTGSHILVMKQQFRAVS